MISTAIFKYANKTLTVSSITDRNYLLKEIKDSNLFNKFELDFLENNDVQKFVTIYEVPEYKDYKEVAKLIMKSNGLITSLELKEKLRKDYNCWVSQHSCNYNLSKIAKKEKWLKESQKNSDNKEYSVYKDPEHPANTLGIIVL